MGTNNSNTPEIPDDAQIAPGQDPHEDAEREIFEGKVS
jgi:hypothetical protein|nr:MAG TPA: hypothetical protein [Caudoviricetes sp.]